MMPTKIVCWLLLLQCTLNQCTKSRLDGFASVQTIPAELLALKNYGAVDFLSSSVIDSIQPNVLSKFPSFLAPEIAFENLFINSNPYAIGVTNFEVPGISIASPVNFEVPHVIDKVISPSPVIFESPITILNTPLEPLNINYPIETSCEYNPHTFSIQNTLNPVVPNLYVEEPSIVIVSPPSIEVPALCNVAKPNALVTPVSNTLSVVPRVLNHVLELPSNNFYLPPVEMPAIPQVIPCAAPSLGPIVDVFSPILSEVPVALEPPVYLNSYIVPPPLVENIPTYAKSQIPTTSLPLESIASSIANIWSIFPSLPTFTPSSRVRNLGGIRSSELSASRGSGLFVTSSSPKRPTGISIQSENTFQGPVSVSGILPFLGTVGFSGSLPSSGYGTVNYRCGSGNVGMLSEAPNILDSFYQRS